MIDNQYQTETTEDTARIEIIPEGYKWEGVRIEVLDFDVLAYMRRHAPRGGQLQGTAMHEISTRTQRRKARLALKRDKCRRGRAA
jgi:hypothetical protein